MFGRAGPVVFDPYRHRRQSWRPPRWLVLMLGGVIAGAGGVVYVEQRMLPPRLSLEASAELRQAFERAESERVRLAADLGATQNRLGAALADGKKLGDDLTASRAAVDGLRGDLAALVASLPPDPRGGDIEVRAGRFTASPGQLAYDVVLTRPRSGSKPMEGVMQLVVTGQTAQGRETTVAMKPVALKVGSHEVLRGSVPLPEGFTPRQTTIQVLDRVAGRSLGMRVMLVR